MDRQEAVLRFANGQERLGGQAVVEHGDEKGPRDPIGRGGGALGLLTRRDGKAAGGRDGLEEEC